MQILFRIFMLKMARVQMLAFSIQSYIKLFNFLMKPLKFELDWNFFYTKDKPHHLKYKISQINHYHFPEKKKSKIKTKNIT